jgi:rare lipoprotein A
MPAQNAPVRLNAGAAVQQTSNWQMGQTASATVPSHAINYYSAVQPRTSSARQPVRQASGSYYDTSAVSYTYGHSASSANQARTSYADNSLSSRLAGLIQVGRASWYGSDFHGRKTANGERYNMESLTAAHRTLPFGTRVKVTNLDNGRECVVRINNRGPYLKGRMLDLSKAAARQIGMLTKGVGRVKMQILSYGN